MLNIFLTVDTEFWPYKQDWLDGAMTEDIKRDIYGVTPDGEFGLCYQIERLDAYGLKAVFFVEVLHTYAVGLMPLTQMVSLIQDAGHDVQLHIHPEWVRLSNVQMFPDVKELYLKNYSEEQQTFLIKVALEKLLDCGAKNVCAFRAGNYGADNNTLHALQKNGIIYDTSYNACYLDEACGIKIPDSLLQPRKINEIYEFPISFFSDWLGHYRHLQLCACSIEELKNVLLHAWKSGWYCVVVVSHSFELIERGVKKGKDPSALRCMLKRFEEFCHFLADNGDKFRTCTFSELELGSIKTVDAVLPFKSNVLRTARRYFQQIAMRY